MFSQKLGMQILSLFTVDPLFLHVFGEAWNVDFLVIYGASVLFACFLGTSRACWQYCSQKASGGSFCAFLALAGKMALRRPPGAHFGHFQGWLAKWLSEGLWGLILAISRAGSQNGSQEASGGSFWAFPGLVGKMALRRPLGAHFGHF